MKSDFEDKFRLKCKTRKWRSFQWWQAEFKFWGSTKSWLWCLVPRYPSEKWCFDSDWETSSSLSEILSRPMHPSPHCVQRLVHFREKQNVVLPKPIICAEKHWWWVAACEFCTNARSFDIVRLTSQSGGFPGSLQRGGGGGHDVRRCRHRAARGDAHALHKEVVKNFTIFGSQSVMTDLKSYQIFFINLPLNSQVWLT